MNRTTVVPNDEIADLPDMFVDELRLCAERPDFIEQAFTLLHGHILDRRIESSAHIERLAVCFRVSPNRWMDSAYSLAGITNFRCAVSQGADASVGRIVLHQDIT